MNTQQHWFHLAQFNIARARAPLDSDAMAEFVGQLDAVNRLAETSSGFVWRLTAEGGASSSYVRAYEDPALLVNMSVWESIGALRDFAYRGDHLAVLRRRQQWFEQIPQPWHVMWWIPAGHTPTAAEGRARLEFLAEHGNSPLAFGFNVPAETPSAPEGDVHDDRSVRIGGRSFVLEQNAPGGDCRPGLTFDYFQSAGRVWAFYGGDGVRLGTLVARVCDDRTLDARYQHSTPEGLVRSGRCSTAIDAVEGGRLRLRERWQWLSGAVGIGESTLMERAVQSGADITEPRG
jgi:hypothetical protein